MPDDPENRSPEGFDTFPTTRWTLVGRAGGEGDAANRDALGELLVRYMPALRAHLTGRHGVDGHTADDLIQGFISSKILERDLFARADRGRGRLRSLLLTALDRYAISEARRQTTRKRAEPGARRIDANVSEGVPGPGLAPDQVFDLVWARQVIAEALEMMRGECDRMGRLDLWGVFESRVAAPLLDAAEPIGYASLVERYGFESPSQASNALVTSKRLFARVLRAVVSRYAGGDEDVDAEIRDLINCLARCHGRP